VEENVIRRRAPRRRARAAALAALAALAAAGGASSESPRGEAVQPLVVRVTGHDFKWLVRYPGADGLLDTADDRMTERVVRLPERSDVNIELDSDDYVYSFYVPGLGIMEMAIPDKPYVMGVRTGPPGGFKLLGNQLCGYTHPELIGDVLVEARSDFEAWLVSGAATGRAP
jgi:heme/copper-type cytochrome/quinol oxidase subunit 2